MAQNNDVAAPVRRYTRMDFTALRYRFNKIPLSVIRDRLYTEDILDERRIQTEAQLAAWLDQLRDTLIERAKRVNPLAAKNLEDARTFNSWPAGTINFLVEAGEKAQAAPQKEDAIALWFRPRVSKSLGAGGVATITDLKALIELRGDGWYRPIPRLGRGKARAMENWLRKHADTVGAFNKPVDIVVPGQMQLGASAQGPLVPLERISQVVSALDGSQGLNRATSFKQISAGNDLEAIQAYLYKFRGRDKTLRAYRKELERFLLWCVMVRRKPMSSALMDDCEAYKDFLAQPDPRWMGVKVARTSPRWRPFEKPLSAVSQRYAVQALRTFFEWLVDVRYLGGNPWATVADPLVAEKLTSIDIDKALPAALWEQLTRRDGILARAAAGAATPIDQVQYRLAHAAIELMGRTGIRREEAASATRANMTPIGARNDVQMWELRVLGKRMKWRSVFFPDHVAQLIIEHWRDRGHDFMAPDSDDLALLSPVVVPTTPSAQAKHLDANGLLTGNGFSPDGLYQVVKTTLIRLSKDESIDLTPGDRALLARAAPHALRHTFATQVTANGVPLDVAQRLLGHAAQATTAIYVRAERERSIEELSTFFSQAT